MLGSSDVKNDWQQARGASQHVDTKYTRQKKNDDVVDYSTNAAIERFVGANAVSKTFGKNSHRDARDHSSNYDYDL